MKKMKMQMGNTKNNAGYAICFNEWLFDKQISKDLPVLLLISSLTARDGVCFASNAYFAEAFGYDEATISRKIKNLVKNKYIEITYIKRGCEVLRREIRLTKLSLEAQKSHSSVDKKVIPTIDEKVKDNNLSINNLSINKEKEILKEKEARQEEVLFESFWSYYTPIRKPDGYFVAKQNKQGCKIKYIKLLQSGVENGKIMRGLEGYLNYCRNTGTPSCAPEVFINQRRWETDYSDNQTIASANNSSSSALLEAGRRFLERTNMERKNSLF